MISVGELKRTVLCILGGAFVSLALAGSAHAATFTVNSTAGTSDPTPDTVCDSDVTADVDCTLVEAVEEANDTSASDFINFGTSNSGDDAAFTEASIAASPANVAISGTIPTVIHGLSVFGGDCSSQPSETSPCARVPTGWDIDSDGEVSINGVAFAAPGTAITVTSASGSNPSFADFKLTNSWFGVDASGAPSTPPVTDLILKDVDGAVIGDAPLLGNVFSRQGTAIDIFGADDTLIQGNTFGVLPDGTFARAGGGANQNGDNIEVTGNSIPVTDDQATGTVIGDKFFTAGPTPECDAFCNLIASAGRSESVIPDLDSAGIELSGEVAQNEIPADDVTIVGNQIGTGSSVKPANAVGISVGNATDVTIGGPAAFDAARNLIGENEITSLAGATGLLIENNVVARNTGVPSLNLRGSGGVLDNYVVSDSPMAAIQLSDTSAPGFTVQGNVIGEELNGNAAATGVIGIKLNATASGNTIGGAGIGDGNLVSDAVPDPNAANTVGIQIAGNSNHVLGNRIGVGSGGSARPLVAGIQLINDDADGADNNTIGGNDGASQNLISNIKTDAIQVTDALSSGNQILRNHGSANLDQFIDLGNDGFGNLLAGPNLGAQAPAISEVTSTTLSGTSAPAAQVRVFIKASNSPGEIEAFMAETTADGSGAWQVGFTEQPSGTMMAATATAASNTSELSAVASVPDLPPETTIDSGPDTTTTDNTPSFTFSSSDAGSSFECSVDAAAFAACSGPGASHTTATLADGAHTFSVRATDPGANVDATPATRNFTVAVPIVIPPDTTPPKTTVTKKPKKKLKTKKGKIKVKVAFRSEAGATFRCRLDKAKFKSCRSPFSVKAKSSTGKGKKHTIQIRATDLAGNVEVKPVGVKFTVIRKG